MAHLPKGQGVVPMPPFLGFLANNIPAVYDNTMSYYEELTSLIKYLQDVVIPALNADSEAITVISNAMEQLQSYVDHYFENLDVQEEINNKLDEMAENGTLQEIITAYIQSNVTWTFDSVADMKEATNLVAGSYAQTLGFHSLNDGGGATYYITNSGTANEMDVIAVDSLYANLVKQNELNVKQFGVYGDGTHDDADALNAAIEYAYLNEVSLYIPDGTYNVSEPINIYGYTTNAGSIYIRGNGRNSKTVIKATDTITSVINIMPYGDNTYAGNIFISNITIDGNEVATNGIEIKGESFTNSKLENINILKCNNAGITNTNSSTNVYLNSFLKIRVSNCATGVELDKGTNTSMRFADCYVQGCTNGYRLKGRYSIMENCCADGITGTVYYFYYFSGTILNPGAESPNASKVFSVTRGSVTITNPFTYGNMESADAVHIEVNNNAHVKFIGGRVLIDPVSNETDGTAEGKLYELGNTNSTIEFDGTEYSSFKVQSTHHEVSNPTTVNNFYGSVNTRNNGLITYIGRDTLDSGGLLDTKDINGNLPVNAIYFGLGTEYRYNSNGTDYRWKKHTTQGDILLSRKPLEVGGIGWIQAEDMTAQGASEYWTGGTYMKIPVIHSGATADRPTVGLVPGQMYFDTTLGKPIWFKTGSTWVDSTGTNV